MTEPTAAPKRKRPPDQVRQAFVRLDRFLMPAFLPAMGQLDCGRQVEWFE